ncbi:hypothetical protein Taro_015422 [Colocasia esculenta]|uniref:Uncharacterized protein n=1 Tax=Colocasia esculenta TaxID=4460 RepID=A0A843UHB7_COLES|nr:hypothetical protein [Colocasia esculenta]
MNNSRAEDVNEVALPYVYPPHFPHEFTLPRRPKTPPRQHPRRPVVSPPRIRLVDPVITKFVGLSLGDPEASSSSRLPVSPIVVPGTEPRSSTDIPTFTWPSSEHSQVFPPLIDFFGHYCHSLALSDISVIFWLSRTSLPLFGLSERSRVPPSFIDFPGCFCHFLVFLSDSVSSLFIDILGHFRHLLTSPSGSRYFCHWLTFPDITAISGHS